jgi:hypothetical protein
MSQAHDLARDIVNVHAFAIDQAEELHCWGPGQQRIYALTRQYPWFEEFHVIGKNWLLKEPLYTLYPTLADYPENAGEISYALMKRWKETPTMLVTCFRANNRCHGIYGGQRRKMGPFAAHHLGLSAVYVALRRAGKAEGWQLEDGRFLPRRSKRPDAFLGDVLIDFGGCYTARRIRELHAIACEWGRPLQIW